MKFNNPFRRRSATAESGYGTNAALPSPGGRKPEGAAGVVIDDRERASGLPEAVARVCGFEPRIERLDAGDILVAGRILIERKTTRDLVVSITDGRLMRQAASLASQSWEAVVIVEGEFTPEVLGGMKAAAVRGAMASVMLDWRIPVFRARSVRETAVWVGVLLDRTSDAADRPDWRRVSPTGAVSGFDPRAARPVRRRRASAPGQVPAAMLSQIPGLGPERARALLRRFGSAAEIGRASANELREVEGIGPRLAEQIRAALNDAD